MKQNWPKGLKKGNLDYQALVRGEKTGSSYNFSGISNSRLILKKWWQLSYNVTKTKQFQNEVLKFFVVLWRNKVFQFSLSFSHAFFRQFWALVIPSDLT